MKRLILLLIVCVFAALSAPVHGQLTSVTDVNVKQINGSTPLTDDPCATETKATTSVSLTTDTVVITATALKKNYICSIVLISGTAEIVSITEGTGSVCATGEAAIAGSTTDANGMAFGNNGGFALAGGDTTLFAGLSANVDTCINVSGSNRVSGAVTWVQR